MRDYLSKLVYHSNSKRGSRRGGSPRRQQVPPERGNMVEVIEAMKLVLKAEGLGCLILVTAIALILLFVLFINVIKAVRKKRR